MPKRQLVVAGVEDLAQEFIHDRNQFVADGLTERRGQRRHAIEVVIEFSGSFCLISRHDQPEALGFITQGFQTILALVEQRDQFDAYLLAEKFGCQGGLFGAIGKCGEHVCQIAEDIDGRAHRAVGIADGDTIALE